MAADKWAFAAAVCIWLGAAECLQCQQTLMPLTFWCAGGADNLQMRSAILPQAGWSSCCVQRSFVLLQLVVCCHRQLVIPAVICQQLKRTNCGLRYTRCTVKVQLLQIFPSRAIVQGCEASFSTGYKSLDAAVLPAHAVRGKVLVKTTQCTSRTGSQASSLPAFRRQPSVSDSSSLL
jgi:hypothetical protein